MPQDPRTKVLPLLITPFILLLASFLFPISWPQWVQFFVLWAFTSIVFAMMWLIVFVRFPDKGFFRKFLGFYAVCWVIEQILAYSVPVLFDQAFPFMGPFLSGMGCYSDAAPIFCWPFFALPPVSMSLIVIFIIAFIIQSIANKMPAKKPKPETTMEPIVPHMAEEQSKPAAKPVQQKVTKDSKKPETHKVDLKKKSSKASEPLSVLEKPAEEAKPDIFQEKPAKKSWWPFGKKAEDKKNP